MKICRLLKKLVKLLESDYWYNNLRIKSNTRIKTNQLIIKIILNLKNKISHHQIKKTFVYKCIIDKFLYFLINLYN